MALGDELDLYGVSYLCGGPRRVAVVVLVALCADGRIRISPGRHRVNAVTREPGDPVEAAALDAIPEVGRLLGAVIDTIARSTAVAATRSSLVEQGLFRRWHRAGPTLRGRKTRRRLLADARPPGLRGIAVAGPEGIADDRLRRAFTTPDPEPVRAVRMHVPRRFGGSGGGDTPGRLTMIDGTGASYDGGHGL